MLSTFDTFRIINFHCGPFSALSYASFTLKCSIGGCDAKVVTKKQEKKMEQHFRLVLIFVTATLHLQGKNFVSKSFQIRKTSLANFCLFFFDYLEIFNKGENITIFKFY